MVMREMHTFLRLKLLQYSPVRANFRLTDECGTFLEDQTSSFQVANQLGACSELTTFLDRDITVYSAAHDRRFGLHLALNITVLSHS
jgi:hypothetical protein